jgi:hypothetical protein
MNHVGFMISPELVVVQDEVQGGVPNPLWFEAKPCTLRGAGG